jgi:hypothetical protein
MDGTTTRRGQGARRKSPTRSSAPKESGTVQRASRARDASGSFRWLYAERAIQPLCFVMSCGQCGPPYATKTRFSDQESARIERCYLAALAAGGSGSCTHNQVSFVEMRQTLADGSVRDVYRERSSTDVMVGDDSPVDREATPCPHEPYVSPVDPIKVM